MTLKTLRLILLVLLVTNCLYAGTTGKMSGKVTDAQTGEPLIGASVIIKDTNRGAATGTDGTYNILNVPPGTYDVTVQMIGYTTYRIKNVRISSDYTTKINTNLSSTVLAGEAVTVTANRPLVKNDLTSSAVSIPESKIAELPVEEMQQFLTLQAGVTEDTKGEIHIRGGRSTEISYLINGIPVTDGFDRSLAIEVENSSIQELQVISGTFNAEYGQAQSGVVNIITKKGSDTFSGGFTFYSGDFMSKHKALFQNIDHLNALAEKNMQARFSGPIPFLKGNFFTLIKRTISDGWLYGREIYKLPEISGDIEGYTTYNSKTQLSDSAYIKMNNFDRLSIHSDLSFNLTNDISISYTFFHNKIYENEYDQRYATFPGGNSPRNKFSWNHAINTKYVFSDKAFLDLSYSNFFKKSTRFLLEDVMDQRYLFPAISTEQVYRRYMLEGLEPVTNQSNNEHYDIQNKTQIARIDFIWQAHALHLLKTGFELNENIICYKYFEVINNPANKAEHIFIPYVSEVTTPRHDDYSNRPLQVAFYLQDKIEFREIVINAGLRYDYFNSRGSYPSDPLMKDGSRLSSPLRDASSKKYLSPRFGLAFPISNAGVIHFSYGHFVQIPDFRSLYWNSEHEIRLGALSTIIGNPDLKPERTVSWELGLQQVITSDMAVYAALYFKNINNLLGMEIVDLGNGSAYAHYINRDYGNVRGVIVSLEKRPTPYFSLNLDYTFQKAMGNASDPFAVFTDNQGSPPRESEKQVVPLDWDQQHTFNATATFLKANKWGVSFILQAGSGLPYTPTDPNRSFNRIAFENSARKPFTFNIDLQAHSDFQIGKFRTSVFVKVYNLFDIKNEIDVFTDTGRSHFTKALNYQLGNRRPDYYSRPRLVLVGMKLDI
ncbi:TonB-dependent receptor [candidate division KSB1 bacterium]|nr:TonB-dependent receptor [candidate division KSB1 bacterium]